MRVILKLLVTLSLFLFAGNVMAACAPAGAAKSLFQVTCDDQSVAYLTAIFGDFDYEGPLSSTFTTPKVFGQLLKVISDIALKIGLLVLAYFIFTSVARTAATGKFLGDKGNLWMPLRTIAGIAMLMPKGPAGYVVIHSVFMWVIFAGIGMADSVWIRATTFLANSSIYEVAASGGGDSEADLISQVRGPGTAVMKGLLCTAIMNYQDSDYFDADNNQFNSISSKTEDDITIPRSPLYGQLIGEMTPDLGWSDVRSTMKTIREMNAANNEYSYYTYGIDPNGRTASGGTSPEGKALRFGYIKSTTPAAGAATYTNVETDSCGYIPNDKINIYSDAYRKFMNEAIQPLRKLAIASQEPDAPSDAVALVQQTMNNDDLNTLKSALVTLQACLASTDGGCNTGDGPVSSSGEAGKYGWFYAGFSYTKIAQSPLYATPAPTEPMPNLTFQSTMPAGVDSKVQAMVNASFTATADTAAGGSGGGSNPLRPLYDSKAGAIFKAGSPGGGFITMIAGMIANLVNSSIVSDWARTFKDGGDPFKRMVDSGGDLLWASFGLLLAVLPLMYFTTAATNVCNGKISPGEATVQVLEYLAILGVTFAGTMFAEGALLGVFLPLVPIIIWIMGCIGWFMGVIEAMVAAPIVALGLMWPDGQNEIFGRAEPALMLLLNLFLRPALLVIGLLAGMLVCKIAFSLAGLMLAIAANLNNPVIRTDDLFGWVPIGFMFAALLIAIAQKSFGLIHELPDKVLTWIGGQVVPWGGADEAVGAMKQGVGQAGVGSGGARQAQGHTMTAKSKGGNSTSV